MEATEQKPVILVVDDTEDNLDLLEFAMKRKPVTMLRANSGQLCLSIARDQQPDVILLDIQMPVMDGFETLKYLREDPLTAKIPVIFLTAQRKDPESIERGLELGADEFLTKPIDTEELLVRTRMLVRVHRAEQEIERMKADFTAMLVHDLRSPITGIKSVIDFFRELHEQGKGLTDEHYGLLDSARDSAQRMLSLINDILDLSKFEAGKLSLDKEQIRVSDIIDVVIREMHLQYEQRNIAIKRNYDAKLPPVSVDAEKIGQVIMNLMSNSLKFVKPGGEVTIATSEGTETIPGLNKVQKVAFVSVTDNGIGIPPEEVPLVFERYKQVSSARKTKQKGTGLGLAVCKLIVEAHGGRMTAASEQGKYTTFRFSIPFESAE